MTGTNHIVWRNSIPWLVLALALLAAACGSDSGDTVAAAAVQAAVVEPVAESDEPSAAATLETRETAETTTETTTDDVASASDVSQGGLEVHGATTFEWTPHCSMGPPLSSEPADCEIFGGHTLLRATLTGERSGTFEGTESLHATFAVAPDGRYVFGGISSFVGEVAECGDGTVVYNTAGWGSFDLEQSASDGSLVLDGVGAISYSPTLSKLNTIDMVVDTEMNTTAPNVFEVRGAIACRAGTAADSPNVTLPESGVSDDEALEFSGTGTFTFGSNCSLSQSARATPPCEVVNGFKIQPLLNSLSFTGPFTGDARFIGTNLLEIGAGAEYEHSGILIFEGTVEGCGDGIVIMVNESAGNGLRAGWSHLRAFAPPQFELGSLGVHVDTTGSLRGFASASMDGDYSCSLPPESATDASATLPELDFDALDAYVNETVLANPKLDGAGIIVVDAQGVLHHESYGSYTLDRISPIASSSKMISAGVLLRLQEEGLLDIDAPLTQITDLAAGHPDLTVAQLLSNSSGLVADPVYPPYFCQIVGTDLSECTATILTTAVYDGTTPELGGGYGMGWWHYDGSEVGDPGAFGARAWINSDAGYAAYWVIEDSFLTSLEYEADLRRLVHEAATGQTLPTE